MRHPLVDMAYKKYFHKSHINEALVTGKTSTPEEEEFMKQADKFVQNIDKYPHAFVLACLMDTSVSADVAWVIPYRIFQELRTFDIQDLYKIEEQKYIQMFSGEQKWHRYPVIKAKVFYDAVRKIVETKFMDGDASKIWTGMPGSHDVVLRFIDFKGCGFKVANMATNILFRYFGVEFSNYNFIDIVPDVHIMRVFQRLGLTPYVKDPEVTRNS